MREVSAEVYAKDENPCAGRQVRAAGKGVGRVG